MNTQPIPQIECGPKVPVLHVATAQTVRVAYTQFVRVAGEPATVVSYWHDYGLPSCPLVRVTSALA